MKKFLIRFSIGLVCLVCAWPVLAIEPKSVPDEVTNTTPVVIASRKPEAKEKFTLHSVPNSYFGINPARRGSLIAGLLLGPIGAAGNTLFIENEGKRQATSVQEIFSLDLSAILKESINQKENARVGNGDLRFELVPASMLFFQDEEYFYPACVLNAVLFDAQNNEKWRARYIAYPDKKHSVFESDITSILTKDLHTCLSQTYSLFQDHLTGAYKNAAPYGINLGDVTLNLYVHEKALPDQVIAVDNVGVSLMRKTAIKNITKR